ncbi:MAG: MATE family efflux transporter [Myxococcota bacterium]|nr:MATE family efflux transporter [Myxococcota bacterium]
MPDSDQENPSQLDSPASTRDAAHEVEAEFEELGDPEAGPGLPSTTLAARGLVSDPESGDAASKAPPHFSDLLTLGWPMMLSQLLVSTTGLVDRAMIGRLDGDGGAAVALAAVGYTTQFFMLIQSALFAVGLAAVALMARAIGAGDVARSRAAFASSVRVAVGLSLIFTIAILAAPGHLFAWLGAAEEVTATGRVYLQWMVGSSVLLALNLTFDSALRADRDTRTPMRVSIAVAAVKLSLNAILIFGAFGLEPLGLAGAGLATALSQTAGVVIYAFIFRRIDKNSPVYFSWRSVWSRTGVTRQVLRVAAPGVAERIVLNLGMLSYFWVLGRYYGTLAVAVYTVGVPLLSFSWIPGTGYGQACAALVGQRLGANDREGARRIGLQATGLALVTALPLAVVFGLLRTPLAELFTDDPAVIAGLGPFMLALAVGQPFLQLHFTLGGAHRGAGDTTTPLVAATVGNWMLRVPIALLAALVFQSGVIWVWWALVFDHLSRAALLAWSFHRGRWMDRLGGATEAVNPLRDPRT